MEEFIHLGGSGSGSGSGGSGGGGNSRGSFLYFPSSTTTNTTSTSSNPQPLMVAPPPPGFCVYNPSTLQHHHPLKSEAGPSQYPYQREAIHVGEEISPRDMEAIKAKIMSHPQYSTLLVAFMDCQKVGAPPDVVERLTAIARRVESYSSHRHEATSDPELDQFMEAYCNMLVKYREEITRPIQEATDFLKRVETQLNSLTNGASARFFTSDAKCEVGSSEEDVSGGEGEIPEIDPCAEEKELKHHLLKKYSGCLSSLRKELSKKKKKGKLPKEARQKLLNWWELHYKWPYPSETEKVALAELTGLDQKQINNWFINQRKRHWKPSEDMQFVVMDGFRPQNAAAAAGFYMEGQFMGDGMYRFAP